MRWLGVSFEAYASASSWGITSEARVIFSTAGGAVSSRIMFKCQKKKKRESALKSEECVGKAARKGA
jgi:hypothetical protein